MAMARVLRHKGGVYDFHTKFDRTTWRASRQGQMRKKPEI